jgi:soluble P-type ATPase
MSLVMWNQKKTLDDLHVFDGLEEERALCEEEKLRKHKIINDLERVTTLEEISWGQKSRALWLREGDKCPKFFSSSG